eukprot:gene4028-306_t
MENPTGEPLLEMNLSFDEHPEVKGPAQTYFDAYVEKVINWYETEDVMNTLVTFFSFKEIVQYGFVSKFWHTFMSGDDIWERQIEIEFQGNKKKKKWLQKRGHFSYQQGFRAMFQEQSLAELGKLHAKLAKEGELILSGICALCEDQILMSVPRIPNQNHYLSSCTKTINFLCTTKRDGKTKELRVLWKRFVEIIQKYNKPIDDVLTRFKAHDFLSLMSFGAPAGVIDILLPEIREKRDWVQKYSGTVLLGCWEPMMEILGKIDRGKAMTDFQHHDSNLFDYLIIFQQPDRIQHYIDEYGMTVDWDRLNKPITSTTMGGFWGSGRPTLAHLLLSTFCPNFGNTDMEHDDIIRKEVDHIKNVIEYLRPNGLRFDVDDGLGRTPLFYLTQKVLQEVKTRLRSMDGYPDIVEDLLDFITQFDDVDVSHQDNKGKTIFHYDVYWRDETSINWALRAGFGEAVRLPDNENNVPVVQLFGCISRAIIMADPANPDWDIVRDIIRHHKCPLDEEDGCGTQNRTKSFVSMVCAMLRECPSHVLEKSRNNKDWQILYAVEHQTAWMGMMDDLLCYDEPEKCKKVLSCLHRQLDDMSLAERMIDMLWSCQQNAINASDQEDFNQEDFLKNPFFEMWGKYAPLIDHTLYSIQTLYSSGYDGQGCDVLCHYMPFAYLLFHNTQFCMPASHGLKETPVIREFFKKVLDAVIAFLPDGFDTEIVRVERKERDHVAYEVAKKLANDDYWDDSLWYEYVGLNVIEAVNWMPKYEARHHSTIKSYPTYVWRRLGFDNPLCEATLAEIWRDVDAENLPDELREKTGKGKYSMDDDDGGAATKEANNDDSAVAKEE